jgi:hypothetical protein
MRTNELPRRKTGRKTRHALRAVFFVVLAAAGLFAGTALPSSTTGTQSARATATMGKQALALEKADLSTLSGIKQYLRAIGVDPRRVVIQRGAKNYAGPNCPGASWTCTNAQSVVQLGTQNTSECVGGTKTDGPAGFQQCLIVQGPAAKNEAKCVQNSTQVPFVRQRCSISQTGAHNEATVVQVADQTSGAAMAATQQLGALQEVGVLQTSGATVNRLQIDQEIKQLSETTGTGITQDQDAYQVVRGPFTTATVPTGSAQQTATGKADNASQIIQKQIQRAKGGATQKQNDGAYSPPAPFGEPPADCFAVSIISPADPNACVNLEQTAANGTNHQGQLSQSIDMEETTTVLGAIQRQHPFKFTGGTDARVHQEILLGMTGSSQNQANQSEKLRMFAPPGADQIQHGGAGCCGFGSQVGGEGNSEQINQQKDLLAVGGTFQTATLVGTSRSPDGECAINHDAQTNGDESTASETADPCFGLIVVTDCENAFVGEDEEEVVGACEDVEVEACPEDTVPEIIEGSVFCEGEGDGTLPEPIGLRAPHLRR